MIFQKVKGPFDGSKFRVIQFASGDYGVEFQNRDKRIYTFPERFNREEQAKEFIATKKAEIAKTVIIKVGEWE